jgi:hypothetical protein
MQRSLRRRRRMCGACVTGSMSGGNTSVSKPSLHFLARLRFSDLWEIGAPPGESCLWLGPVVEMQGRIRTLRLYDLLLGHSGRLGVHAMRRSDMDA